MDIRPLKKDEFVRWRTAVRYNLGSHVSEEDSIFMRDHRVELDRLLACFDGDTVAGSGGADSFQMTLPGGASVPVAGIGYITTTSTYRRRGIQRAIMNRIHQDARDREEAATILWSSQSRLYTRYGYGNSIPVHNWEIDTDHARFAHRPAYNGRLVRPTSREQATEPMQRAYDAARKKIPGMVTRSHRRWLYEMQHQASQDEFFLIYLENDQPQGYVRYRLRHTGEFTSNMNIAEAVAATPQAHAALWQHLLEEDLVQKIIAHNRPTDDPLYWMLADPRRLKRNFTDAIWMKILDTPEMLRKRTYHTQEELTLEIHDSDDEKPLRLKLQTAPDGAQATPTRETPDIVLSDSALASAYMGAVPISMLVKLGLAQENAKSHNPARRADHIFKTTPAAWNPHHF